MNKGFDQGKMTISLSYKTLWGIMSVPEEDKTMYQTCDMDGLIKVSPHAVFYIFHMFIGLLTTGTKSAPYLPVKALLPVAVYVSGLVALEKKQTQSRIAKTIGHVTHDALNRLAGKLPMLCAQMAVGMTSLITGIYDTGYIILDDTVVPKPFSRLVAGTYVDYDHTQKRHVRCHRIVVVIWTNGVIYIPVAFAFWHHRDFVKKYRTKNQIARILVYYVARHGIPFSYLTFDNWYASKQNLRFFGKLGIKFVTRLRNNTWIVYEKKRHKIQKLTKYECHYYDKLNAYVKQFEVKYPGFGAGTLAIVKNDKHAEPGRTKYLFTNDLSLTNREIVLRYRSRWHVEVFFRTCKQNFGLCACQAQMMPQVILHARMVFLAYVLAQLLLADDSISVGEMQKHLRSLHCLYQPKEDPKLVSMHGDGTLIPITLEELINPIRTKIPSMMDAQIPDIIESINVA
jgi:hypothetical protein